MYCTGTVLPHCVPIFPQNMHTQLEINFETGQPEPGWARFLKKSCDTELSGKEQGDRNEQFNLKGAK